MGSMIDFKRPDGSGCKGYLAEAGRGKPGVVVIQRVPYQLQFFDQLLEHFALDRVLGEEIEDEAILGLAVPVDATHTLLQPVRVPRDVVVEQDMAALKVDALASGFRGDQHLRLQIPEAALRAQPGALFIPAAGLHAAVNLRQR